MNVKVGHRMRLSWHRHARYIVVCKGTLYGLPAVAVRHTVGTRPFWIHEDEVEIGDPGGTTDT